MPESESHEESRADPVMLRGFWYPAARSAEINRGDLRSTMLLGDPLVIGRGGDGRPFVLLDSCPHRAMPLSCGRFDNGVLECPYHGWRFDVKTGGCIEIPSLTEDSTLKIDRIRAGHYVSEDQDGYIWVFLPDPDLPSGPVSPVPRLPVFSPKYKITHLWADLPCSVDHGIIGLMDPAHGPFVHQSWWWRSRRSIHEKEKVFEPIPNGFRVRPHAPSANSAPYKLLRVYGEPTTTIEFILPNMRLEQIRCGPYWFASRATVTPVTQDRCRIDFCAAWNIFPRIPFVLPVFRLFARMFLRQDQQTMEKQAIGLKHTPKMILIDDADRPARWYFQLKSAHVEAKRTGQPMKHPIPGPVSLRWRS